MREEFAVSVTALVVARITPAHAGRMECHEVRLLTEKDHPRACGKNDMHVQFSVYSIGSPPRMREEFHTIQEGVFCNGITPAHAGRIVVPRQRLPDY